MLCEITGHLFSSCYRGISMLYVVPSICSRVANKFYLSGTEEIAVIHSTPSIASHFFSFCHCCTLFSGEDSYINATEPKETNICFSHPMDNVHQ
jgi:hypothetical protein